jgi:hypothetical protein
MTQTEKQIMKDSPEAEPTLQTMDLWRSASGKFFVDKKSAERDGYTHEKCPICKETIIRKGWSYCDGCRSVKAIERYNSYPEKEYESGMVFSDPYDKYFSDLNEAIGFCEDEEIEISALRLQHTEPIKYQELTSEYWSDYMTEDGELDKEVEKKIEEFNLFLNEFKSNISFPVKIRVKP